MQERLLHQPITYSRDILALSDGLRARTFLRVEIEQATAGNLDEDYTYHAVGPDFGVGELFFANGSTETEVLSNLRARYAEVFEKFEKDDDERLEIMQRFIFRLEGEIDV